MVVTFQVHNLIIGTTRVAHLDPNNEDEFRRQITSFITSLTGGKVSSQGAWRYASYNHSHRLSCLTKITVAVQLPTQPNLQPPAHCHRLLVQATFRGTKRLERHPIRPLHAWGKASWTFPQVIMQDLPPLETHNRTIVLTRVPQSWVRLVHPVPLLYTRPLATNPTHNPDPSSRDYTRTTFRLVVTPKEKAGKSP